MLSSRVMTALVMISICIMKTSQTYELLDNKDQNIDLNDNRFEHKIVKRQLDCEGCCFTTKTGTNFCNRAFCPQTCCRKCKRSTKDSDVRKSNKNSN